MNIFPDKLFNITIISFCVALAKKIITEIIKSHLFRIFPEYSTAVFNLKRNFRSRQSSGTDHYFRAK